MFWFDLSLLSWHRSVCIFTVCHCYVCVWGDKCVFLCLPAVEVCVICLRFTPNQIFTLFRVPTGQGMSGISFRSLFQTLKVREMYIFYPSHVMECNGILDSVNQNVSLLYHIFSSNIFPPWMQTSNPQLWFCWAALWWWCKIITFAFFYIIMF